MVHKSNKLRTSSRTRLKGAPDSQKDPTVDRSFLPTCGKQKWRFSLQNWTLQSRSKMERFLYGIKMSTFFLLLVCHSL
jgi:hypothetical protein